LVPLRRMDVGYFGAGPFEGVEVYEVEATAPIHESFGELGHPN
jgi:hypothetical protein